MRRPLFLGLFLLLAVLTGLRPVRAQAGQGAEAGPVARELARRFPAARFGDWELVDETTSPVARYQTWRPMVGGRWLWPGTVRVSVALNNARILGLRPNRLPALDQLKLPAGAARPNPAAGSERVQTWLATRLRPGERAGAVVRSVVPVWYATDSAAGTRRAGWLATWGHPDSRIGAWEVLLDEATGAAVGEPRDLLCYSHAAPHPAFGLRRASALPDTTARAWVFRPDPLTTAGQPYGRPYIDSLDTDRPALNQQRVAETLHLTWAQDSFRLRNRWVAITEFDPPTNRVVAARTAAGLQFTRAQAGFEQVNALFHLTRCRAYVDRLGFPMLFDYPIRVDVNGMSGADQSRFSPIDTTLSYGEGGVDDAEDADVLTHEYTHALAFAAAPNTNQGLERRTLEEANADYWAAVHSARLGGPAAFGREQVFNWDGHNEFWSGRWVISQKLYPTGLVGSIYRDADVWSSTLWQIRGALPDTVADRVWLLHLYDYAPDLTMPEAARLFLRADSLLYGATHADTIFYFFDQRHILGAHVIVGLPGVAPTAEPVRLTATDAFAHGEAAYFRAPTASTLALLDATGRVVWRGTAPAGQETPISAASLPPGLYVLRWQHGRQAGGLKLMRE